MKKLLLYLVVLITFSCSKSDNNGSPNLNGLTFIPTSSLPGASYYGGQWYLQSLSTVSSNTNIINHCQLSSYFYISSVINGYVGVYHWVTDNCDGSITYDNMLFSGGGDYLSMGYNDNTQTHTLLYGSSMTKDGIYLKLILIGESYFTLSNKLKSTVTYPEAERKVFIFKNNSK